jgi:hypothetical protein
MTDILVTRDILGAANPHGAASLANLYAAMPSLHAAWAAWCAAAVVVATRSRWRHLARFYPPPGATPPPPRWWCWARPTTSCWTRPAGSPS